MPERAAPRRHHPLATAARGVVAAGVAAAVWGTLIERQLFTLRHVTMPVLPAGQGPLRMLQLSDLHLAPWQSRKQRWVRSLAALAPDLVINSGDNAGHEQALFALRHALEPFAGIPGVFVHGSNDYYGPMLKNPLRYLREPSQKSTRTPNLDNEALTHFFMDDLGWLNLNNSAARLTVADSILECVGLNDPHIGYDRADQMAAQLAEVRAEPAAGPVTTLGLVHAPYRSALNTLVDAGATALIAGHTHGGQVCIPGYGALTTNCDLPRDQAKGLSTWQHNRRAAFLNVSAGLGHSIYAPVRFACRPEATLITLVPAVL
ncbi:metallophosphoesterase [Klugiella xanthotipulae]|uniref:Putative MPP superfamily phosphohydrolase n=1 Tax=Klugiella xanthotipulae TaxID=244735 RepID=A0A543HZ29_9MICO|nr:putative MPP superfamily phosphohydrolase [Klugiella xanthotipulae]